MNTTRADFDPAAGSRAFIRQATQRILVTHLFAALVLTLILACGGWLGQRYQEKGHQISLVDQVKSAILKVEEDLLNDFRYALSDLYLLAASSEVVDSLATGQGQTAATEAFHRHRAESHLSHFLNVKWLFHKARLLNPTGQEQLVVRRLGSGIQGVEQNLLQDKSSRDYFKSIQAQKGSDPLEKDWVYISDFDLNMEFGRIEVPHLPTIRFATPVFDPLTRQELGILLLSYQGQIILDKLRKGLSNAFDTMLLNPEGGYLFRPLAPTTAFAFMTDPHVSFADEFPESWSKVQSDQDGVMATSRGWVVFKRFYPLRTYFDLFPNQHNPTNRPPIRTDIGQHYFWTILVRMPPERVELELQALRTRLWQEVAVGWIALIMAVGMMAMINIRRRQALAKGQQEQRAQQVFYELQSLSFQVMPLSEKLQLFLRVLLNNPWLEGSRGATLLLPGSPGKNPVVGAVVELEPGFLASCPVTRGENCRCTEACTTPWTTPSAHPHGTSCYTLVVAHGGEVLGVLGIDLQTNDTDRQSLTGFLNTVSQVLEELIIRDRTQEELAKLYLALEQSPASVVITDINGTIEYVNQKFTEVSGYTAQEAKGTNPRILKSGVTEDFVYRELWTTILAGREWHGELCNRRKDGTLFWESASISPLRRQDGTITHFIAVKENITNLRKEMEERLLLEKQLRQAQKMEAIGHLTGGIAHDFNNILVAVNGYAELALMRFAEDENSKLHRYLKNILEAGQRARDLVAQMLAFGRSQESEARPVAALPILKAVVRMVRATFPTSISLTLTAEGEIADLLTDPVQFHQVALNLLVNARDAVGGKGRIDIGIGNVVAGEIATCSSCHGPFYSGEMVAITVRDDGSGIAPEHLEKIFQPFYTTKEVGKGSGMGLAVVHGILHSHGGHLLVHSEPNRGTDFQLFFPKSAHGAAGDSTAPPIPVAPSPPLQGRILVVDDEGAVATFLKDALEEQGFSVLAETDSRRALALFQADPHRFDLVITDMTMPEVTGKELALAMLALRPGMPIMLCTGYSREIDEETAIRLGIRHFLTKPIDLNHLIQMARKVLSEG